MGVWQRGKPHVTGDGVDQGKLYGGCHSSNGPGGLGKKLELKQ